MYAFLALRDHAVKYSLQHSCNPDLTFHLDRINFTASPQVLLGLQLPSSERAAFTEATAALGGEFSFSELSGAAKGIFEMFIQ